MDGASADPLYQIATDGIGMMRAADIHSRISWAPVLEQLGIAAPFLRDRHGPCPACGGKDRFRFDNRHGRGDFYCNGCGPGDGFELLKRVHGWSFAEARRQVLAVAGMSSTASPRARTSQVRSDTLATPTERVRRLRRETCVPAACPAAVAYLGSRGLWPLPPGCAWRAHPTLEYWSEGERLGRYPGLVADITDVRGELVSVHVTYITPAGTKLQSHEPRKILSPLTGREGCAVRLMQATDTLAVAEGIETALAFAQTRGIPTWAALNSTLLAKFTPPENVKHLHVAADRDEAGLTAAARLMEQLQGRVQIHLHVPPAPAKDWNDALNCGSANA